MKENEKNIEELSDLPEEELTTPPSAEEIIATLQAEVSAMKDQWLRSVAETENIRKRAIKEKEDALKYAATNFARDIIGVADNLRRALESCTDNEAMSDSVKSLVTGVEMTEQEFLKVLEQHNIRKITPLNERFDPHYHQAMFEVENPEVEPGTIVQVMQAGYVMHDRLLRPALVGVAKGGTPKTDITV